MRPRIIQVFEHSALKIDPAGLTEDHFEALVRYNERNQNRFFEVGHRRLYFGSFVGVIQAGQLTIEIMPKADRDEAGGKLKWRGALLDMLKACHRIRVLSSGSAKLQLKSASLADLYFETFLFEAEKLLHEGLRKAYRQKEGNRSNLKGRLIFSEQIKRNLVHRERFYTRYVDYNRNSLHNQILSVALCILGKVGRPLISSRAKSLLLEIEDIQPARPSAELFERLSYDRNTNHYRPALQLARLIILNYAPDFRGGCENVMAILFDINALFEEYVYRRLKAACRCRSDVQVSAQQSKAFWRSDGISKSIRPDIVVDLEQDGTKRRVIIDTKWKIPKDNRPGDDDLKQMYAYNLQFGATQSVLVYPRTASSKARLGRYSVAPEIHGPNEQFSLLHFLDLFDGSGRLDRMVGHSLLQELSATVDWATFGT